MRIVRQTVRQGLDRTFKRHHTAVHLGQHAGPARKPSGKFIKRIDFGALPHRVGSGFAQGRDQRGLDPLGQNRRFNRQCRRDVDQKLAADSASVVFDQVQV